MGSSRALAIFVAAVLVFVTSICHAQDDITERRKAAQALADNAFDLMQKKLFAEAATLFRKADERFHSPVFVLFESEALDKQGQLLRARALLERTANEELAEYAPRAFRKAQETAATRLRELDARIPTITITLPGAEPSTMELTIDDRLVDPSSVGAPIQVDPGSHVIVATADGRRDDARVELAEGERKTIELDIAPRPAPPPPPEPTSVSNWIPAGIAFGVAGAGLIVGAAVGGVFIGRANDLKDQCAGTRCPASLEGEGDDVAVLGNVSTAAFVIAGVGAVAGTLLLLLLPEEVDETAIELKASGLSLSF